jgi:methylated-DNA-[protein]-cysteine S-methyltransferase
MENTKGGPVKYYCLYRSSVGLLQLVSDGSALVGLIFIDDENIASLTGHTEQREVYPFQQTVEQLDQYFQGNLQNFDIPILLHGTKFQLRVWNELRNIPFGKTMSYKAQADKVGNVARAVGLANGRNPIPIIVPCHRVIGANGRLVGYGGGLDRKRALLQFEAIVRDFGPHAMRAVQEFRSASGTSGNG